MHARVKQLFGTVIGVAALGAAITPSAAADPGSSPAAADIVGVGSATTQYVINKYTTSFPGAGTSANPNWSSWNAVGSSTITPSAGCASITRPNGSSAGLTELATYGSGANTNGCIDFARSSRGPKTTGKNYAFFAYGKDGLTWASWGATGAPVPASLTTAQLQGIYQSSTGVAGGPCTTTNWNQVGGSNAAIKPAIPQIGSGARDFFLATLGVTALCNVPTFQENDGTSLATALDGSLTNAIAPYSIADYIAQRNATTTGVPDVRNSLILRNINGKTPCSGSGNCSGSTQTLSSTFDATFLRKVYNVVKTSNTTTGTILSAYKKKFGTVAQGGVICSNPALVTTFGFAALGSGCGAITYAGLNP
jgi:hypothetical protein